MQSKSAFQRCFWRFRELPQKKTLHYKSMPLFQLVITGRMPPSKMNRPSRLELFLSFSPPAHSRYSLTAAPLDAGPTIRRPNFANPRPHLAGASPVMPLSPRPSSAEHVRPCPCPISLSCSGPASPELALPSHELAGGHLVHPLSLVNSSSSHLPPLKSSSVLNRWMYVNGLC